MSRRWRLIARNLSLASIVGLVFAACATSPISPGQPDPQAVARGAVILLKDAWLAAEHECKATAVAKHDDSIRVKCERILTPVRGTLIVAGNSVDAWGAVDQKNLPCLVNSAADALLGIEELVPQVKLPVAVSAAVLEARGFTNIVCANSQSADGGAE